MRYVHRYVVSETNKKKTKGQKDGGGIKGRKRLTMSFAVGEKWSRKSRDDMVGAQGDYFTHSRKSTLALYLPFNDAQCCFKFIQLPWQTHAKADPDLQVRR